MLRKTILLFSLFLSAYSCFCQNKKEQILELNRQIENLKIADSIQVVVIAHLGSEMDRLSAELKTKKDSLKTNRQLIAAATMETKRLNALVDSLNSVISYLYTTDYSEWITLNKGNTKNGFTFSKSNSLLFNGTIIKGLAIAKGAGSIKLSPLSRDQQYVICYYSDDISDFYSTGIVLCDLYSYSCKTINIAGPPMCWASWSPGNTNVLLATYYEADMALYNIQISPYKVTRLNFPADIKVSEDECPLEEITYEIESIKWTNKNIARIPALINCNPYCDDNCDNDKRNIRLRSYIFTVNVSENKILNKEKK